MGEATLTDWAPHHTVRNILLDQDFLPSMEFHHLVAMRPRLFRERNTAIADEESAYRHESGGRLHSHKSLVTAGPITPLDELKDLLHEHLPRNHSAIPIDHAVRLVSQELREFLPREA